MNPIDLEAEYIDDFTPLTEEVNDTRLVHVNGIQFAILGPLNTNLFAFESISFARFIQEVQPNLNSFRFAQTRTAAGEDPADQRLLFVWMLDGRGVLLDEKDQLILLEKKDSKQNKELFVSATKAFGLPPKGHLARMLMTERLVNRVEDISESHSPTVEQILYLMYREFVKARLYRAGGADVQLIAGEHFIFETRAFNEQLTVFDLNEPET